MPSPPDEQPAAPLDSSMPRGDWPIASTGADRLGRATFASALAEEILNAPRTGGFVIGLCGPWGSGKTSILRMAEEAIAQRAVVMRFNPWFFTGTEMLISAYFSELSKTLRTGHSTWKSVANKIAIYGEALAPFTAPLGTQGAVAAVARILKRAASRPPVDELRHDLADSLRRLPQRLVVLIDDVDRLRAEEVQDIMRLVRLVGDFPSTTYVLAFDRERVEHCLGGGDPEYGRAYLEKIVQVAYDVPLPREVDVSRMFLGRLGALLEQVPVGPFTRSRWEDINVRIINPLLVTPRHAARLLEALPLTLRLIGDEVAVEDVIALEALRVLKPDFFDTLVTLAPVLGDTTMPGAYRHGSDAHIAGGPLSDLNGIDFDLARLVCQLLFPAATRHYENRHFGSEWIQIWRRERLVANPDVFRFYLERQLAPGVAPARVIDEIFHALGDVDRLEAALGQVSSEDLVDALQRLSPYIEELEPDALWEPETEPAFTALSVIAGLFAALPGEQPGFFGEPRQVTVGRVINRLLHRLQPADAVRAVQMSVPRIATAESQLFLVGWASRGDRPIVDQAVKTELETVIRDQLLARTVDELAANLTLLDIPELLSATGAGRTYFDIAVNDDGFFVALIMAARTRVQSAALGSVAVTTTHVLQWRRLTMLVEPERLLQRAGEIVATSENGETPGLGAAELAALALVLRYESGWRPEHDPDELFAPNPVAVVPDDAVAGDATAGESADDARD